VEARSFIPVATIDDLKDELRQFGWEEVLLHCYEWSCKLDPRAPTPVDIPSHIDRRGIAHTVNVGIYSIALIARLSLLVSSRLAANRLTDDSFLRLLSTVSKLYKPVHDPVQFFIQTAYEQFWYQNPIGRVIPRALLMYRDACRRIRNPKFDIPQEFSSQFGITIMDFIALSFILFTASREAGHSIIKLPISIKLDRRVKMVKTESVDAFLKFNSAGQDKFRDTAIKYASSGTGDGRYDFNPFFKFPLVCLGFNQFIAPLPDMIIWRIKNGPYFELKDMHEKDSPKKNPFSGFFGYVFQEYVGLLLEDTFGKEDVLPEVPFGKPQKMGPDWIVTIGNVGIAIECTNSDLTLPTKTLPKTTEVHDEVKKKYVDKIRRLPSKIQALTKPGSPYFNRLNGISRWHYLLVYREPLYLNELFRRNFFDTVLGMPTQYHIMDIEEFESLLALNAKYGVDRVLFEKESCPTRVREDFHHFLASLSQSTGIVLRNTTLQKTSEKFFNKVNDALKK